MNTINRHWDSLGDAIQINVMDFSERLADHLLAEGRENAIGEHAPLNPEKNRIDVATELNHYACSKPIEGGHLTTGHVLRIEPNGTEGKYWLCLSPACDLVPGQKETGWHGRLGDHMPFIAVQLFGCNKNDALSNATDGNYLFLEIDQTPKVFSFTPVLQKANDETVARIANPKWEQMFAANKGRFDKLDEKTLSITRISQNAGGLEAETVPARVVAQLRYEYAINLLQRLGVNLSRVGLDFIPVDIAPVGSGQTEP